jgi:hypothetical protein
MGIDFEVCPKDRENLLRVCREHSLPLEAARRLEEAAGFLKLDEQEPLPKSAARRRTDLRKVTQLAQELNELLQALEFEDRSAIHREFKLRPVRLALEPPDQIRGMFTGAVSSFGSGSDLICENVLLLGDALLTLADVAGTVVHGIEGDGTGRPQSLDRLAMGGVHRMARIAWRYRIRVGRGGTFHALCEAVFLAAGINIDPDNAIRRYTKRYSEFMGFDP